MHHFSFRLKHVRTCTLLPGDLVFLLKPSDPVLGQWALSLTHPRQNFGDGSLTKKHNVSIQDIHIIFLFKFNCVNLPFEISIYAPSENNNMLTLSKFKVVILKCYILGFYLPKNPIQM